MSFRESAWTSWIRVLGAQHFVPDLAHLKRSVISAFRKQVKESSPTMQVPGHSSRGSGAGVVVVVVVVVVTGRLGGGRGRVVVEILESSQQTDPLLQLEVLGMITEGLSQKAAMMFRRQNPGQRGGGGWNIRDISHIKRIPMSLHLPVS